MHRFASLVYNLVGPQTRECGCNAEVSATCGDMVALCLAKLVSKGHTLSSNK